MWNAHSWWKGAEQEAERDGGFLRQVRGQEADDDAPFVPPPSVSVRSAAAKEQGNALFRQGDLDAALLEFDRAIRLDHYNSPAWTNMALVYLSQGKHESARQAATASLAVCPTSAKAKCVLGLALAELGEPHAALNMLREALAESLGNKHVRKHAVLVRQPSSSSRARSHSQVTVCV